MSDDEPTPEQAQALDELDNSIRKAWEAYGRSQHPIEDNWERTPPEERILNEWCVLLGVTGNREDQVDMLFPHFPSMPIYHAKGLLAEGLDQLRGDEA